MPKCNNLPLMMIVLVSLWGSACSYSHVGQSIATFNRPALQPDAGSLVAETSPITFTIRRHLDTILRGPDTEEDQVLTLEVRDYRLNKKLLIPSDNVTADFTVTRFGPSSRGVTYTGYLIVKKITPNEIDATLSLVVTAVTDNGAYTQTAKYDDTFKFLRPQPRMDYDKNEMPAQ